MNQQLLRRKVLVCHCNIDLKYGYQGPLGFLSSIALDFVRLMDELKAKTI